MVDLKIQDRMDQAGKKGEEAEVRMTFGEHIEELRGRLIKSIAFLLLAIVVAMYFYEKLVWFITRPHVNAMIYLNVPEAEGKLMPGSYGGPIIAIMKLAFIVGFFVSSPFIGYQLWAFVGAGLYKNEKKYVVTFAPISFVLFCIGCAFGFKVLIPYCLIGLAKTMTIGTILSNQYLFSDYLSLVMMLTIILGGVFQVPLLMVFLSKIGLVKPSSWNKWRRHAIIINLLFAAIVTPADVFSMIMVAIPLLVLYEIGFVISWVVARPPKTPSPAKP
jgi:sec-independent protein translocase protein TatC